MSNLEDSRLSHRVHKPLSGVPQFNDEKCDMHMAEEFLLLQDLAKTNQVFASDKERWANAVRYLDFSNV